MINSELTLSKVVLISLCFGVASSRISAESLSRGRTEMRMRMAIKREQMGSAMNQPNCSTRIEEMMTPTLPNVSASTCRNTPRMFELLWE